LSEFIIAVHRAGCGIDAQANYAAKNEVPCRHDLNIGADDIDAWIKAGLAALDLHRVLRLRQNDARWCRDHPFADGGREQAALRSISARGRDENGLGGAFSDS